MSVALKSIQDTIECYELVREWGVHKLGKKRYGDQKTRDEVLGFIPTAALSYYLFYAEHCGHVVAMSIIGPTHKPSNVHCFSLDGKFLFCYYALVHPRWRLMNKGLQCLRQMVHTAMLRFPETEIFCHYRQGGTAYREYPITSERSLGVRRWAGQSSGTGAT